MMILVLLLHVHRLAEQVPPRSQVKVLAAITLGSVLQMSACLHPDPEYPFHSKPIGAPWRRHRWLVSLLRPRDQEDLLVRRTVAQTPVRNEGGYYSSRRSRKNMAEMGILETSADRILGSQKTVPWQLRCPAIEHGRHDGSDNEGG